jgi:hypothetical protein
MVMGGGAALLECALVSLIADTRAGKIIDEQRLGSQAQSRPAGASTGRTGVFLGNCDQISTNAEPKPAIFAA